MLPLSSQATVTIFMPAMAADAGLVPWAEAGISTIIWATGYTTDYRWLKVNAFDDAQRPQHHRGVSTEPGVYFLGLPWLSRRGSTFIWGVWHDAKYIADQIAIQRQYQRYQPSC